MNAKAKEVMQFIEENPAFKGKFVGWTLRDGLGITRIDDRWYECNSYLIDLSDLKDAIALHTEHQESQLKTAVEALEDMSQLLKGIKKRNQGGYIGDSVDRDKCINIATEALAKLNKKEN